jgi:hypothetical protein
MPISIVSDRDPVFTSHFWKDLFGMFDTKLQMSSAYHPQSDGQTERVNQSLEMYLRCAASEQPTKWFNWLPLAEFWYNTSHHSAIGCSPFKALYKEEPHYGMLPDLNTTVNSEVKDFLVERQSASDMLQYQLAKAQERMKHYADKNRSPREFQVGDSVFLKLQPYVQHSVVQRTFPKLSYKFYGPYKILAKIGQVAYKLQLPDSSKIHPVFHVSQLKPFKPDFTAVSTDLPVHIQLDTQDLAPEEILERRLCKKGNAAHTQLRIKWTSLPASQATWEDYDVLRARFPNAPVWGQASGGSGVTPAPGANDEHQ